MTSRGSPKTLPQPPGWGRTWGIFDGPRRIACDLLSQEKSGKTRISPSGGGLPAQVARPSARRCGRFNLDPLGGVAAAALDFEPEVFFLVILRTRRFSRSIVGDGRPIVVAQRPSG